jgi:hypothetical protein
MFLFLAMAPNIATFYGNRSAAYMMISNYDKALEDSLTAIKLDNAFVKVKKCFVCLYI